jgi:hypothetical protein
MENNNQKIYDNASYLPEDFRNSLESYFVESDGTNVWKLQNFTKFVPRQSLTRFIVRYEIFKKILNIQGSIVEAGVLDGASLMTWAQLSSIFEPLNYQRKIIGFDLFGELTTPTEKDVTGKNSEMYTAGLMNLSSYDDIQRSISIYDKNRFLSNIPKVSLVKGDVKEKAKEYIKDNPHTIVSLLYLDINLYEPTKAMLDIFLPRMPKGSIVIFDELNDEGLPGESIAVLESFDLSKIRIQRFEFDTKISYAVIG